MMTSLWAAFNSFASAAMTSRVVVAFGSGATRLGLSVIRVLFLAALWMLPIESMARST